MADLTEVETGAARPRSVMNAGVAAAGALAFVAGLVIIVAGRPFAHDAVPSAMLVVGITTLALFALDLGWQKVHLRPSTGLDFQIDDPSWRRTLTKLVGLLASVGFVALAYGLLPEYDNRMFDDYFEALRLDPDSAIG